jgi:hypothetical protein
LNDPNLKCVHEISFLIETYVKGRRRKESASNHNPCVGYGRPRCELMPKGIILIGQYSTNSGEWGPRPGYTGLSSACCGKRPSRVTGEHKKKGRLCNWRCHRGLSLTWCLSPPVSSAPRLSHPKFPSSSGTWARGLILAASSPVPLGLGKLGGRLWSAAADAGGRAAVSGRREAPERRAARFGPPRTWGSSRRSSCRRARACACAARRCARARAAPSSGTRSCSPRYSPRRL